MNIIQNIENFLISIKNNLDLFTDFGDFLMGSLIDIVISLFRFD
jgi:hypothetical protein